MSYKFQVEKFFPKELYERITDIRVKDAPIPGFNQRPAKMSVIQEISCSRKKRNELTKDGKLTILACDHPARMVTNVGDDPVRMGNRYEYLGRILRVITLPEWDGVMGTTDIIEDLMILDWLVKEQGGKSFLDRKVMIGCMNRGGLNGATFELDDRFTSFTADSIYWRELDGAKLMLRLDPNSEDSLKTIEYCAKAIDRLNYWGINVFLECLYVAINPIRPEKGWQPVKRANELVKVISVATALGDSSRHIWLKIPYCENFEKVARATTCPILMLGGEAKGDPTPLLQDFINGMKAGSNVRGVLVGRNILYPGEDDPRAIAGAVSKIVHEGYGIEEALEYIKDNRGKEMKILKPSSRR